MRHYSTISFVYQLDNFFGGLPTLRLHPMHKNRSSESVIPVTYVHCSPSLLRLSPQPQSHSEQCRSTGVSCHVLTRSTAELAEAVTLCVSVLFIKFIPAMFVANNRIFAPGFQNCHDRRCCQSNEKRAQQTRFKRTRPQREKGFDSFSV